MKNYMAMKKLFLTTIFILTFPMLTFGAERTFTWNPNTEDDLAGYKLHVGETSRGDSIVLTDFVYDKIIDVGNYTIYTLRDIEDGVYFASLTAYDLTGNMSDYSSEVTWEVDTTPPEPPAMLEIMEDIAQTLKEIKDVLVLQIQ